MKRHALRIKTRYKTACVTQVLKNSSLKGVRESGHRLGGGGGILRISITKFKARLRNLFGTNYITA
jgi:hypothetical protein